MVHVPPELIDAILSNLHSPCHADRYHGGPLVRETKEDLKSCTLVCRSWTFIAMTHLFREIGYSFSYDLESTGLRVPGLRGQSGWLEDWHEWQACRRGPLKTLQDFYIFLQDHPRISACVCRLYLRGYLSKRRESGQSVHPGLLVAVIDTLPNLSQLELYDVIVTRPSAGLTPPLHTPCRTLVQRKLESLRVEYECCRRFHPFTAYNQLDAFILLSCFRAVDRLHVDAPAQAHSGEPTAYYDPETQLQLRFHSFSPGTYGETGSKQFLRYMLKHPEIFESAKKIIMDYREERLSLALYLSPVLHITASTIEELEIGVFAEVANSALPLAQCTALRTLKIRLYLNCLYASGCVDVLDSLVPLFRGHQILKSTHESFRSLVFDVEVEDFHHDPSDDINDSPLFEDTPQQTDLECLEMNMLDKQLVRFVEESGIRHVQVNYTALGFTSSPFVEKLLPSMFKELHREKYLMMKYYKYVADFGY